MEKFYKKSHSIRTEATASGKNEVKKPRTWRYDKSYAEVDCPCILGLAFIIVRTPLRLHLILSRSSSFKLTKARA